MESPWVLGVECFSRPVIDAQIGLRETDALELRDVEPQGLGMWDEPSLVAQHVLDVFRTHMAGRHDLLDGASRCRNAEELDKQNKPDRFAMN
jgi:hypothetical protein